MEKQEYCIYNPRLNAYKLIMAMDFCQAFKASGWSKDDNCVIIPPGWPRPHQIPFWRNWAMAQAIE